MCVSSFIRLCGTTEDNCFPAMTDEAGGVCLSTESSEAVAGLFCSLKPLLCPEVGKTWYEAYHDALAATDMTTLGECTGSHSTTGRVFDYNDCALAGAPADC